MLLSLFIIIGGTAMAQSLTIEECKQKAHDNYPAIRQYGLIEKSRDLNVNNASKAWLPDVNVSAFGAGFTDVIDLNNQSKAILDDMDNYILGASVNITQAIYDAGAIKAQQEVMKAKADVEQRKLDVSMYDINSRIDQLFFGTLMLDEQLRQNKLLQDDLGISEKTVKSLINGGLANQSDLDAVNVRQLQAQQQEINLKATRQTYLSMLGYFIGQEINEGTTLTKPALATATASPSVLSDASLNNNRPELSLFSSQEQLLNLQRKALDTKLLPTVGAMALGTLHTTPMDMMKSYTIAIGLTAKWNIGALYTRKNDIANIENQRSQIATQRETFLFNNALQNKQSNGVIDNLQQQMKLDDKAVSLRESIREKAEKKVKNGTETVNELLRDVNAVSEAKQQKAIHEIQLLQEIYKLKTINNRP